LSFSGFKKSREKKKSLKRGRKGRGLVSFREKGKIGSFVRGGGRGECEWKTGFFSSM